MKDGFAQLNINEKATVDQKPGMSLENVQPARTGRKKKKKQKSIRSWGQVKGQASGKTRIDHFQSRINY